MAIAWLRFEVIEIIVFPCLSLWIGRKVHSYTAVIVEWPTQKAHVYTHKELLQFQICTWSILNTRVNSLKMWVFIECMTKMSRRLRFSACECKVRNEWYSSFLQCLIIVQLKSNFVGRNFCSTGGVC